MRDVGIDQGVMQPLGLSVPRWQGDMHGTYYAYAFNCQAILGFRN